MADVADMERGRGAEDGDGSGGRVGGEGGGEGGEQGRGGQAADGGGEPRQLATPDSCIADFCLIPVIWPPNLLPISTVDLT
jgi:hypothetical protein